MNEHTPRWRTSSYSEGANNCVEVAHLIGVDVVRVKDSKNKAEVDLAVPPVAWSAFLAACARR